MKVENTNEEPNTDNGYPLLGESWHDYRSNKPLNNGWYLCGVKKINSVRTLYYYNDKWFNHSNGFDRYDKYGVKTVICWAKLPTMPAFT